MRDNGQRRSNIHDGVKVGIQAEGCEKLHFHSTKGNSFHKPVASYGQSTSNTEEVVGGEVERQTHLIFMRFQFHFLLGFGMLMKMSVHFILSMGVTQYNSVSCKVRQIYAGSLHL